MLQQIVTRTPFYVWIVLGVLVWRGLVASRDRVVPLRQLFIIPAVMALLALQEIGNRFGVQAMTLAPWLAGAALGAAVGWRTAAPAAIADGGVFQRGSWLPLALMLAVFLTKYVVAVSCAVQPGLARQAGFAVAASALFGIFNGLFAGRALRAVPALLPARARQTGDRQIRGQALNSGEARVKCLSPVCLGRLVRRRREEKQSC